MSRGPVAAAIVGGLVLAVHLLVEWRGQPPEPPTDVPLPFADEAQP